MSFRRVVLLGLALGGLASREATGVAVEDLELLLEGSEQRTRPRNILVVGFDDQLRGALCAALREEGFLVYEAASSDEAVGFCSLVARRRWPCERVDVLVIDGDEQARLTHALCERLELRGVGSPSVALTSLPPMPIAASTLRRIVAAVGALSAVSG